MKYEPIKDKLSIMIGDSTVMRRLLYSVLGLIFLREWHVKRALRKTVRKNKSKEVLDAGSGFGQYSYYLANRMGVNVTGVDINRAEIGKCGLFARKMRMKNLAFDFADLEKLDFDGKFDLIVSVDVMEHIRDDVAVFRNFERALQSGGRVVISTPSNFGGSDVHDEGEHSFIEEHFREGYSAEDITSKLAAAKLNVESIRYTYGKIGSWYWNLAIKIPVKLLNKSFGLIALLPFYYIIALPFSIVFMSLDYFFPPSRGSGLLVVARKGE